MHCVFIMIVFPFLVKNIMIREGFPHSPFPDSVITSFLFMLDALTLSPSSVTACDGELVVFTCTVNEGALVWRINTPTRNYDPLAASAALVRMRPLMTPDGVFSSASTSYTTSPVELVSTLTTTATRSLDGTVVQCEGGGGGGRSGTANITFRRNVDNNTVPSRLGNLDFDEKIV